MPMLPTRLRDNLFNRLFSGVTLSPADQAKVTNSLLIWAEEIIAEMERADIELEAADITIDPGTFEVADGSGGSTPVTGEGVNAQGTIPGRIR